MNAAPSSRAAHAAAARGPRWPLELQLSFFGTEHHALLAALLIALARDERVRGTGRPIAVPGQTDLPQERSVLLLRTLRAAGSGQAVAAMEDIVHRTVEALAAVGALDGPMLTDVRPAGPHAERHG